MKSLLNSRLRRRLLVFGGSTAGVIGLTSSAAWACDPSYPGGPADADVQPGIAPIRGGGAPRCEGGANEVFLDPSYTWQDEDGSDYPLVVNENFRSCNFKAKPSNKLQWNCTGDNTSGAMWRLDAVYGSGTGQVRSSRFRSCGSHVINEASYFRTIDGVSDPLWHLHFHIPAGRDCTPANVWGGDVTVK